ncbi:MAG: right-handed parallel beta-helix repeat-containing protein [Thermoplasmata archaeon]|nr:MAG: right-handed parallel beta-helix repeat-containing protein [Thermoplasmata archaeon]
MNRRISALLLGLVMAASISIIFDVGTDFTRQVGAVTHYVGGGGGGNHSTIQEGIDAAGFGDTVYVYSGTYNENVIVNKSITLTGEDRDITVIDGGGSGIVVKIVAGVVSISGFTITHSGSTEDDAGIWIDSDYNTVSDNKIAFTGSYPIYLNFSDDNVITNNIVNNNPEGILLDYSEKNEIRNNSVYSNNYVGIGIRFSNRNVVSDNQVWDNVWGMSIFYADENTIIGNDVYSNDYNGIKLEAADDNDVIDNEAWGNGDPMFIGNSGIGLYSSSTNNNIIGNKAFFNNNDGIYISDSEYNIIIGNNASTNNEYGIFLRDSNRNTVTGNNASDEDVGIYLDSSNRNYIIGNNASNVDNRGFYLWFSSNNHLIDNVAYSNGYGGFYLHDSSENTITDNIVSSSQQSAVYVTGTSNDNYIANCSISSSIAYDFYLDEFFGVPHATVLNTTFDKSKVYFDTPNSTFTVKWYMHVYVESTDGLPISGATVEVTNITGDPVEGSPFISGSDGFVRWIVVSEFIQNDTNGGTPGGDNKRYFTPHNVTVTLHESTGYAKPEPLMDSSKVVTVVLDIEKPQPDAGVDAAVDEDEPHVLNGSGSVDNVGIVNWTWDFGDGVIGYGKTANHTYTSSGTYVAVLNVTDGAGNWNLDTVNIFVNNVQPTADAGSGKFADEGEKITFNGSDSYDTSTDNDSLMYWWDFGDGSFGTGKIVTHRYDENGTYTVTLQVTDDDGSISSDSFTVMVNNTPPEIGPVSPQFLVEDQPYMVQIIATDVKGDTLTFSDNATMFDINPVTGVISFTPENSDVGTYLVNITVTDDDGAASYLKIQFSIQNTNDGPIITSYPLTAALENSTYYYNITVKDDDLDVLTYVLDLNPEGMDIDSNGTITWVPSPQQASQAFMVIVHVSDGIEIDTQTFSVTVININDGPQINSLPITNALEDAKYLYDVNASDRDIGDWLIYSLDTGPDGMSIDSLSGLISWAPTNDHVGHHPVIVNVTDFAGAFACQEFTIYVSDSNDAPVLGTIGPFEATEGEAFSYIITVVEIDEGDLLTFSDDTQLFDINSTTGNITFTPSNNDVGVHFIRITVTDSHGAYDYEHVMFTINNVNGPPILMEIGTQTLTEDKPFTFIVTAADDDFGDSLTFLDNSTLFEINPYTGKITFTPTNGDVGTYQVNITVKDGNGSIACQTVTFTVNNVNDAPSVEGAGVMTLEAGKAFSYSVTATDVDYEDTVTFSDDTDLFDIDPNTGEISFTPGKKDGGFHYVTITVTDGEGETDQMTFTLHVLEAEEEEPYDFTWVLLLVIVGLVAPFIGHLMSRRRETQLPEEEEERSEPEEIEMELSDEEPEEVEGNSESEEIEMVVSDEVPEEDVKGEGEEKEVTQSPSEEEEIFEFETMEEEGLEDEKESVDLEEKEDMKEEKTPPRPPMRLKKIRTRHQGESGGN